TTGRAAARSFVGFARELLRFAHLEMSEIERREALRLMAAAGLATWSGCGGADPRPAESLASFDPEAGEHAVLAMHPLGPIWETSDPFLFCAHHDDHYPAGNERLGPAASLRGRQLGMDFEGKDGWRMYHGEV